MGSEIAYSRAIFRGFLPQISTDSLTVYRMGSFSKSCLEMNEGCRNS